jgi:hypothetical protein
MTEVLVQDIPAEEELLLLDDRESDRIKVELLYRKVGDQVLVHLIDEKEDNDLTFPVPADRATDAFNHPYSYYGDFLAQQAA